MAIWAHGCGGGGDVLYRPDVHYNTKSGLKTRLFEHTYSLLVCCWEAVEELLRTSNTSTNISLTFHQRLDSGCSWVSESCVWWSWSGLAADRDERTDRRSCPSHTQSGSYTFTHVELQVTTYTHVYYTRWTKKPHRLQFFTNSANVPLLLCYVYWRCYVHTCCTQLCYAAKFFTKKWT